MATTNLGAISNASSSAWRAPGRSSRADNPSARSVSATARSGISGDRPTARANRRFPKSAGNSVTSSMSSSISDLDNVFPANGRQSGSPMTIVCQLTCGMANQKASTRLNPARYAGNRICGLTTPFRNGCATYPATPVTPSRIKSPVSDSGDPAYQLERFTASAGVQPTGGSRNVLASDPTNVAARAPGAKVSPDVRTRF